MFNELTFIAKIIHCVSLTCGRSVVFSGYSGFPHQYNWLPRYNWNIVESDIKHHNPNHTTYSTFNNLYHAYIRNLLSLPLNIKTVYIHVYDDITSVPYYQTHCLYINKIDTLFYRDIILHFCWSCDLSSI